MSDKERLDEYLSDMDKILDRHINIIKIEIKQAMVEAARYQLEKLQKETR